MDGRSFVEAVPKVRPGDRVAVISPAFAAPAISPVLHEQAMRRLKEATGFIPVEYPTTRQLGASAEARAADVNALLQVRAEATRREEEQILQIQPAVANTTASHSTMSTKRGFHSLCGRPAAHLVE